MANYYHGLEKGCFRLLSLSDDTGLVYSLETHLLDKTPPYVALSYTWGPATHPKGRSSTSKYSMTLNGKEFDIQQNLHDALQYLAKHVRRRDCSLWVDAICINQNDMDEGSAQVREMKRIYENANYIFAWLGLPDDEDNARLAVDLMADFNRYLQTGLAENKDDIDMVWPTIGTSSVAFPVDEASGDVWKGWEGIADMLSRPYWERTWIYQEATTPGEIWFFCGDHQFDDVYLSAAVAFGLLFSASAGFDDRFVEATGQASSAAALCSARIQREKDLQRGLVDLITEMRLTRCTDERDKVFAPLGHAADLAALPIAVDSNKSLRDVYVDVARFVLSNTRASSLEILGLVFTPADDASNPSLKVQLSPTVPSWVPDWRQTVSIPGISRRLERRATGGPLYGGGTLHVKGVVLANSTITSVTAVWDDQEPHIATPRSWYNELMAAEPESSRDSMDISVRRSLVGDRTRVVGVTTDDDSTTPEKRGGMVDWDLIDMSVDELDVALSTRGEYMIGEITAVCHGRRVARLRDKSVVVVPAAAKVGDEIAMFFGGQALYVTRAAEEQGTYMFIGECYVDGYMHGALMDTCGGLDKVGHVKLV